MNMAKWWLAGASLAVITGCASQSSNNAINTPAPPPTTMNAPYSSDTAGVQDEAMAGAPVAYLPRSEMDFSQLPQPVQAAIRQEAQNVPIDKIIRETKRGDTVYKVELKRGDGRVFHGSIVIAADGTVLKESHLGEAAGASAAAASKP